MSNPENELEARVAALEAEMARTRVELRAALRYIGGLTGATAREAEHKAPAGQSFEEAVFRGPA